MDGINVIIIDDEQEACSNLQNILNDYIEEKVDILAFANSTREAEEKILSLNPDAIFLDIEMPNENAFQFLERLPAINFEIVFVTAYDEYAIRAFKLNAVDYILKPINIGELGQAVKKLRERLNLKKLLQGQTSQYNELAAQISQKKKQHQIILRDKNDLEVVPFKDIIYVKAMGSYSQIVFSKGSVEKSLVMSRSIADYEEMLPSEIFFRAHKSYLVNCFFVKKIMKDEQLSVQLTNNTFLPVSRRRLSDMILFLKSHNLDGQ